MSRSFASNRLPVVPCDPASSILQSAKEGQDGTSNRKSGHLLRKLYLQRLFRSAYCCAQAERARVLRVRGCLEPESTRVQVWTRLESARVCWRLESLGGRRRCVGAVVVPRAQVHTDQEKIFTGVVDTWRVGTNQQYLYSIGEYLIFAWLFQRNKVACRGILTAQDSSPLDSLGGSSQLVNNTRSAFILYTTYHCGRPPVIHNCLATGYNPTIKVLFHYLRPALVTSALGPEINGIAMDLLP